MGKKWGFERGKLQDNADHVNRMKGACRAKDLEYAARRDFDCQSCAFRAGLGVVGGFEKRPPGTKAQLKIDPS
jgi:hypothetical protein